MTEVGHWGFWVCVCPALWPLDLCVCVCLGWVGEEGWCSLPLRGAVSSCPGPALCSRPHTHSYVLFTDTHSHVLTQARSHILTCTLPPPHAHTMHTHSCTHTHCLFLLSCSHTCLLTHAHSPLSSPSHIHVHHSMPAHSCTWTYMLFTLMFSHTRILAHVLACFTHAHTLPHLQCAVGVPVSETGTPSWQLTWHRVCDSSAVPTAPTSGPPHPIPPLFPFV